MKDSSGKGEGSPLTLTLSPEYRGEGIVHRSLSFPLVSNSHSSRTEFVSST